MMSYVKGYTPLFLFLATVPAQAQKIELSADTVLVDQPFKVAVTGLPPGQEVTVRLEGNRGVWHSSAVVRSDARGRAEVADPMRLIWSATGKPVAANPGGPGVQPWVVTAEVAGKPVATDTLWRRAMPAGIRVTPVREKGLFATWYLPPTPGPHPTVIVLAGSQGGMPAPAAFPGGLASNGYAVLALPFFNFEGLPPMLKNIPLEYFGTAIDWLKSQATVDSTRIAVLGTSRGGELALILGATYPSLHAVVANVPSNVVWPGMSDDTDAPAWTLNGQPLTAVPTNYLPSDATIQGRDRFLRRMRENPEGVKRAEIPVERINGPLLMFSGKDDQIWPSDTFAARVVERLKAHNFNFPVEHYSYENAGHMITRPYVPTSNVREMFEHPVSHRTNMAGGTPEGQARANEDSWARLLAFLSKYLGK